MYNILEYTFPYQDRDESSNKLNNSCKKIVVLRYILARYTHLWSQNKIESKVKEILKRVGYRVLTHTFTSATDECLVYWSVGLSGLSVACRCIGVAVFGSCSQSSHGTGWHSGNVPNLQTGATQPEHGHPGRGFRGLSYYLQLSTMIEPWNMSWPSPSKPLTTHYS